MGINSQSLEASSSSDTAVPNLVVSPGAQICTNTAVRLAARRLGQLYDEALAPLNLKATQFALLVEIAKLTQAAGQAPTLQDLAYRLAIQLSALTHALRPLVRDGLVELRQDALDRRTKRGVLTSAGTGLLSQAVVRWAEANQRVEAVLSPVSAAHLRALADQVSSDAFLLAYRADAPAPPPSAADDSSADF